MKRVLLLLCVLTLLLALAGCGEKKLLHCDGCGTQVSVDANSNMEEDWIIYCEDCNERLFGDHPILGNN